MFARSTPMGIPEPQNVERATGTALTLFLYKPINRQCREPGGILNYMLKDLRRVTFSLGNYEFIPNPTPQEQIQMEELSKERQGFFHCWVNDVDNSKDIPYIKTMALVEDESDGTVHMVEYQNLKFSKA